MDRVFSTHNGDSVASCGAAPAWHKFAPLALNRYEVLGDLGSSLRTDPTHTDHSEKLRSAQDQVCPRSVLGKTNLPTTIRTMIATLNIQTPSGPQPVRLEFARVGDDSEMKQWKAPRKHSRPELAKEPIDLAKLAGKRWRYYLRRNEAATSMAELLQKVGTNSKCEVGFIIIAKAIGAAVSSTLGVAWCRRTWCNHLVLDFLTVHPALNDPVGGYKGMGLGLFIGIAVVAEKLDCRLVWGEATETSCTFYQKLLGGTPVLDHFFFGSEALATLRIQLPLRSQLLPNSKP